MSANLEPIWMVIDKDGWRPMCTLCFRAEHLGPCERSVAAYWRKRAIDARADAVRCDERAAQVEEQTEGGAA